jgi:hypothetical protein
MNKERIIREFVRSEILNVLKESGPSKGFKKAAEELYDAELKQQKLKDKFIKSKSTAEKQLLKQELIAQHKLVQIAQQKFSNMLMIEPADDLDESVKKKRLRELELTTQTTGKPASNNSAPADVPVEATENAEEGLEDGLKALQQFTKKVEESKSKSPRKKPVNEFEPISFTLGTLLSTPGILKGLGWVSDKISKPFLKDKQKGTIVGKALAHASHWLEDKYLGSIAAGLKAVYPETFPMEYAENNELGKAAKKVYMVMLMAAGVHAGMSAVNAHSLIIKSIEGGATLVKSAEAIELATALVEA